MVKDDVWFHIMVLKENINCDIVCLEILSKGLEIFLSKKMVRNILQVLL